MIFDLTIEEIKDIASNQLTAEEVMILKLLVNMDAADLAEALEVTTQHIYQIRKRAHQKIVAQDTQATELLTMDDDDDGE